MAGLSNEPDMKIRGQINKALEEIRDCLFTLAEDESVEKASKAVEKARYLLSCAENMCRNYRVGLSRPWREYQPMIAEEFDE
jgi:hypothetical protein